MLFKKHNACLCEHYSFEMRTTTICGQRCLVTTLKQMVKSTIGHMNICYYIYLVSANANKGLSKWQKWNFIKGGKCSSLVPECQSALVHLSPISSFHISTSYTKGMKKLMYQSPIVCMRFFFLQIMSCLPFSTVF